MRDNLKKLITEACEKELSVPYISEAGAEALADYLLSEGVIVPPCKIGDTVYMPWEWNGQSGIACLKVGTMHCFVEWEIMTNFETDDLDYLRKYKGGVFKFSDFGKTVFLTQEEAEKALERSKEE